MYLGYQQLEKNNLNQYQVEASSLIEITNRILFKRRMLTNTLPVEAFDYYQQVFNPITRQSQRVLSPLSQLETAQPISWLAIKGLIGYFQYDSRGQFNSPIWPNTLSPNALANADKDRANQQAPTPELKPDLSQKPDTELIMRKSAALNIYQIVSQSNEIQTMLRQGLKVDKQLFNVTFDVADYLIFYRVVSVAQQNRIQGYVVDRRPHLSQLFTELLQQSRFASPTLLTLEEVNYTHQIAYFFYENSADGQVQVSQPLQLDRQLQQQAIYSSRLRWPYSGYSVSLSTSTLPMTSAMMYSSVFIMLLMITILAACYGFYRLGVKQLALAEQRLNFVSSVSHELKTPLTSIRMYAEMLKEGTVISTAHQQDYYQFIYGESERLTRLINNILQLSALNNQQQNVQPEYTQLTILQDIIRSKTSTIIDKNSFVQNMIMEIADPEKVLLLVEQDAFAQVIINITDNTVKFFDQQKINDASRQKIDFTFRYHPKNKQMVQLEIRDYGEGITVEQQSKIFELFYRGGNELTRTTQGTGIGLALVNELVMAQQGEVKVERKAPGLAMLLSFQAKLRLTPMANLLHNKC
jgi:signal transduction histidine kinase